MACKESTYTVSLNTHDVLATDLHSHLVNDTDDVEVVGDCRIEKNSLVVWPMATPTKNQNEACENL